MRLFAPILLLTLVLLGVFVYTGSAQDESGLSQPAMTISLLQTRFNLTSQVPVSVVITNSSDVPLDGFDLNIIAPDFLQITNGDCVMAGTADLTQYAPAVISLESLPAQQVMIHTLCLSVDRNRAISGTYQLLFSLVYQQDQRAGSINAEKEIQVDLIGADIILGIPLAFAGVILPGVMLLIALRWFGVPWAEKLTTEDRVIFGVVISLGLLGLITWLSVNFTIPGWMQQLAQYEQVTISQIAWYIGIGISTGVILGGVYWLNEKRKARREADLKITPNDPALEVMRKMLTLNPDYKGGKVGFKNKNDHSQVQGWHYCETDGVIEILGKFRLSLAALPDEELRNSVKSIVERQAGFSRDGKRIRSVVKLLLAENVSDALVIAEPVIEIDANGNAFSKPGQFHKTLEKSQYEPVTYLPDPDQVILDVID